jgi:hypothetical protein
MSWRSERARLAVTARDHPDDHERLAAIRRSMRIAYTEERLRALVASADELSPEERNRLAVLLLQGGAAS